MFMGSEKAKSYMISLVCGSKVYVNISPSFLATIFQKMLHGDPITFNRDGKAYYLNSKHITMIQEQEEVNEG